MSSAKEWGEVKKLNNLRERLAKVIGATSCIATDLELADAVIAGLGLRSERVGTVSRWVSEWVPDE